MCRRSPDTTNPPEAHPPSAKVWALRGLRHLVSVPAFALMGAQIGFAALCREFGVTLGEAIALTVLVWALPGQIIYIGLASGGASFAAVFVAVSLSALRFLPMMMTLAPMLRGPRTKAAVLYAVAPFVAITSWVFAVAHLPKIPRAGRMPFFATFAVGITITNTLVVVAAYLIIAAVPPLVSAMLTFLMPVYFLIALLDAAKVRMDIFALCAGLIGLPIAAQVAPEMDILLAGLLGGTLAYGAGRLVRRKGAA